MTALRTTSGMAHVSNIVTTAAGQEAATWDAAKPPPRHGGAFFEYSPIAFWRYDEASKTWHQVGKDRYPAVTFPGSGCNPKIHGALVQGASDAVYLLQGCQSGDGGVNSVIFANGPSGWGLLVHDPSADMLRSRGPRRHEDQPTKRGRPFASWWQTTVVNGLLQTNDGNPFFAIAAKGAYARHTSWRWSGSGLVHVRDDAFTAAAASPPDTHAPSLPGSGCPNKGTVRASFGVKPPKGFFSKPGTGGALPLLVFPKSDTYPASVSCRQMVSPTVPMTVQVAHTSAHPIYLHNGTITNRRWVTAPAWFLMAPDLGGAGKRTEFFPGYTDEATSPYVVPTDFHVNLMLAMLGHADSPSYRKAYGHDPHPAIGTVTFSAGKIVAMSVDAPSS